jgi:demethylmenaquinone methyltransferase/2-methoxy-6-polyprenyl-1,4-benzoquinol methylase
VPINESQMQSYYATRAPEYDAIYLKPERQQDLRRIEKWLPPLFADSRVLEIACGTGYWTQFIAPAARHIIGIDASQETMNIARDRVPESKATFLVGDAYSLSPSLGRFNAAFAGFWFSHVPKARRQEFLYGLTALLEPGALVVLLDNLYVEGSSSAIAEADAEGNTYQDRKLGDGTTHRVLKNFPSQSELESSIKELGRNGKFTTWQHYWAFEYVATWP